MPLLGQKEVLNLKLSCIKAGQLKILASKLGVSNRGKATEIIKRIFERQPNEEIVNEFIKQRYRERIKERRAIISDEDLKKELMKVKTFSWGVVQGQLDQKIQSGYVRKFVRYNELINNVKVRLHNEITNYVICTWFNHLSLIHI